MQKKLIVISGCSLQSIILMERNLVVSETRCTVADVSGGSRTSPRWGRQPTGGDNIRFCQIFQKNCMKLKEFRLWGTSKILLRRSAAGCFKPVKEDILPAELSDEGNPGTSEDSLLQLWVDSLAL